MGQRLIFQQTTILNNFNKMLVEANRGNFKLYELQSYSLRNAEKHAFLFPFVLIYLSFIRKTIPNAIHLCVVLRMQIAYSMEKPLHIEDSFLCCDK